MTADARWLELCMDTDGSSGRETLGRFWAAALGLEFHADGSDEGPGDVVGDVKGKGIAICPVPESKTVKHRVHIDVRTGSVADLVGLGATVLLPAAESGFSWTVLADPEGGELCAFVREPAALPAYHFYELVVDCADPEASAAWWGERFGVATHREPEQGFCWIQDLPGVPFDGIVFVPVPEPKTVKNRIHWDVYGDPAALEAAGATRLWETPRWVTLADPEGNEFCVFAEG